MSRRTAKKCERLWREGVALLRLGQYDAAAVRFTEVLEYDPTAADAWLGLHATGRSQAEAVEAMGRYRHTFGELRTTCALTVRSRFDLGLYVSFRLETSRDLWLAGMAQRLSAGQVDEAEPALLTAVLDCDETRFLCTRYAYLKQNWPLVLEFSRGIEASFLRDEAQLYVGYALARQGVFHEVLRAMAPLPPRAGAGRTVRRRGRVPPRARARGPRRPPRGAAAVPVRLPLLPRARRRRPACAGPDVGSGTGPGGTGPGTGRAARP
ncbi:hypothetical protein ACIOMM_12380 [Streptomyces sp. NPDC087908]|uniref:hypothetical protein n=1 Tax=Streptomyces sp. NPDC087908 TaxID=3365820 RepID=UPI00381D0B9B